MKEIADKLKEARSKLKLSIDDISSKTKIRPHILIELENGNFTFLPPVYIISFLKTYASFLKFSEDEINDIIEGIKIQNNIQKPSQYQAVIPKPVTTTNFEKSLTGLKFLKLGNLNQPKIINYLIYSALVLTVIALIYITFFMNSHEKRNFSGEKGAYGPDTAIIRNHTKTLENFYAPPDSIVLEATGVDTAWLRIVIDGHQSDQLLFTPRVEKKWIAKEYFLLSIGNVGAINFKRNGTILPAFGTKGSVIRNIKITYDKVDVSSAPWSNPKDSIIRRSRKKVEAPKPSPFRMLEPSNFEKALPKLKK